MEADFVGIGQFTGGRTVGRNDEAHTMEITTILKGVPRKVYLGDVYFADVHIPPTVPELAEWSAPDLLLFLAEHGMDLNRSPYYPLSGDGLVIADAEARRVVQDTLAHAPVRPRLPFCVVLTSGYAYVLSQPDSQALGARLASVFTASAQGRCIVGTSSMITSFTPEAGDQIRKLYLGASAAVFVSISNRGEITVSGFRIGADRTKLLFSGEPWPSTLADELIKAREILDRLPASK
jgi:hypothetical protein